MGKKNCKNFLYIVGKRTYDIHDKNIKKCERNMEKHERNLNKNMEKHERNLNRNM
jgi:ActR/RegA family two-component response regulator